MKDTILKVKTVSAFLRNYGKKLMMKVSVKDSRLPVLITKPSTDDIWEQDYMRDYFPVFLERN